MQTLRIDQSNGNAPPTRGASAAADTPPSSPFPPGALGVTAEQIAEALQVSVKTVRRMDGERLVPGRFVVGRRVRFKRDLVEEWIAGGCASPRARRPR